MAFFGRMSHLHGLMALLFPFPVRYLELVAVFCLDFRNFCVCSVSRAAAVMERGIAAALTCAGELISARLQTLLLLLAVLDQAGPVGIDQEMGYGGKIQLVIVITK